MLKLMNRPSTKLLALFFVHFSALVGMIALFGVAEQALYLTFIFVYLIGIYLDLKGIHPIKRLLLNAFALVLSVYLLSFLSLEDMLRPFANVVMLLLSIKSLEDKKPRDMYQILLLSLFGVSISTVYNLSISFAFILLFEIAIGLLALIFVNLYRSVGDVPFDRNWIGVYTAFSFVFFLLVCLLTVPFFVLLPRTEVPLFYPFGRSGGMKTGIADEVTLGKVGEVQQDNTVAFRVYGLQKGMQGMYWRVSVFDTYMGNSWITTNKQEIPLPKTKGDVSYSVILEPTFEKYLPALDYPVSIVRTEGLSGRFYMASGGVFMSTREIDRPIRYWAFSSHEPLFEDDPELYQKLPKGISESIKKLAQELARNTKDDEERVERVKAFFKRGFKYSLSLGRYQGDPLDHFLFVSKKGNCEYYASATAILLRLMGVPTRVVGGFKGGIYNSYGNYYMVTNSMAHVWTEAYVGGRWIRVDTTPPYLSPAVAKTTELYLIRDSIVSFWYSNVVGFSSQKQFSLFKRIHKDVRLNLKPEKVRGYTLHALKYLLALIALYTTFKLYSSNRKTVENLYRKFIHTVKDSVEGVQENSLLAKDLLKSLKGDPIYSYAEYIVLLYQRYKYSPYKVYKDEVLEGYRALSRIKKILKERRRVQSL